MEIIKKKFTPKNLWSSLIMSSLFISLWVLAGFTVKYFVYLKQSNYSIAEVFEWGVIEMDEDNYLICADFRFHTDGIEEYVSQHLFEETTFSTKAAAEIAIEKMKKDQLKCYWFGNSKDPKVSLKRVFPLKNLLYTLVSFGVLLYFTILKRRFSRFDQFQN